MPQPLLVVLKLAMLAAFEAVLEYLKSAKTNTTGK
jgi:hypothetical protein